MHSAGLESAWQQGEVRSRAELESFLETSLRQAGRAALPFVLAAHDDPARWGECDRLCDAFTSNHVANRASRAQGRALRAAVERVFPGGVRPEDAAVAPPPYCHLAPAFGVVLRRLGLDRETGARLFLFQHLRGLLAAAVRLNLVGPMEAQSLQHRLAACGEEVAGHALGLTLDDLAQTAPLLELWQGGQDRLPARLFQS